LILKFNYFFGVFGFFINANLIVKFEVKSDCSKLETTILANWFSVGDLRLFDYAWSCALTLNYYVPALVIFDGKMSPVFKFNRVEAPRSDSN